MIQGKELSHKIYNADPEEVTEAVLKDWGRDCAVLEVELSDTQQKIETVQDCFRLLKPPR